MAPKEGDLEMYIVEFSNLLYVPIVRTDPTFVPTGIYVHTVVVYCALTIPCSDIKGILIYVISLKCHDYVTWPSCQPANSVLY